YGNAAVRARLLARQHRRRRALVGGTSRAVATLRDRSQPPATLPAHLRGIFPAARQFRRGTPIAPAPCVADPITGPRHRDQIPPLFRLAGHTPLFPPAHPPRVGLSP